jgi:putative surface protein
MGIMDAAIGSLSNVINDSIEKIKELKILTMNEVFNELKEKINRYNELSKETERLGVNNSEVAKVEEEIRNLKSKIDELNSSIEFKSKIEKMKITLNVTSIESEITLKEINLEEEKKKAEKDYDSRIQIFNKNLEDTKKELEEFIKNIEKTLEKTVKREAKKRGSKNLELPDLQKKGLNKLGLSVLDLSEVSHLVALELKALEKLSTYSEEEIEKLNLTDMSDINKTTAILTGIGGIIGASYSITAIPNGIAIKPYLRRLIIIKNNKIAKQKLIEGTELEETKNYYDNIMKVEFLNLENIEKEETELNKKITSIKENIHQCDLLANESKRQGSEENFKKYSNLALDHNNKLLVFEKENEKLKIKKETIQNKINTVNEMVDEMIKEVIKEELKKREIVIPASVPVTKYFNVPSEE